MQYAPTRVVIKRKGLARRRVYIGLSIKCLQTLAGQPVPVFIAALPALTATRVETAFNEQAIS